MRAIGFAVVLCLGVFIIWLIYTYNRFVNKQSQIDEIWDEADVHLKLRHDLIPVLIERARGRMPDDTALLDRVAELGRETAGTDITIETEYQENELSQLLRQLRDAAKKYPDLMLDEQFVQLLGELVSMEGRAASACDRHNALVRDFNEAIHQFPATLIVGFLHFTPREMRIFRAIDDGPVSAAK